MSAGIVAEVGKFYRVPCIKIHTYSAAADRLGWVPVLGPKHADTEFLNFPHEHFHIDWRFVGVAQFREATKPFFGDTKRRHPHGQVVTNTHGNHKVEGSPEIRRKRCARLMPDHPVRKHGWHELEIAQAFRCNKLLAGNICPHRGIDLTPFEQQDGTAVCPGHGLRWNLRTGELMVRHGATP